jgi:hypothetical protein
MTSTAARRLWLAVGNSDHHHNDEKRNTTGAGVTSAITMTPRQPASSTSSSLSGTAGSMISNGNRARTPPTIPLSAHSAARRARLLGSTINTTQTRQPPATPIPSSVSVSASPLTALPTPTVVATTTVTPPSSRMATEARNALDRIVNRTPPLRTTSSVTVPGAHSTQMTAHYNLQDHLDDDDNNNDGDDHDHDHDITSSYDPEISSHDNNNNDDDDDASHANRFLYRSAAPTISSVSRSSISTPNRSSRVASSSISTLISSNQPPRSGLVNSFARASASPSVLSSPSILSSSSSSSSSSMVPYRIPRPLSAHSSDDSDNDESPTPSSMSVMRHDDVFIANQYVSRNGSPRSRYYFTGSSSNNTSTPSSRARNNGTQRYTPSNASSVPSSTVPSLRALGTNTATTANTSSTRSSVLRSTPLATFISASSSPSSSSSSSAMSSTVIDSNGGAEVPLSPGALRTRIMGLHSRVGELQHRVPHYPFLPRGYRLLESLYRNNDESIGGM